MVKVLSEDVVRGRLTIPLGTVELLEDLLWYLLSVFDVKLASMTLLVDIGWILLVETFACLLVELSSFWERPDTKLVVEIGARGVGRVLGITVLLWNLLVDMRVVPAVVKAGIGVVATTAFFLRSCGGRATWRARLTLSNSCTRSVKPSTSISSLCSSLLSLVLMSVYLLANSLILSFLSFRDKTLVSVFSWELKWLFCFLMFSRLSFMSNVLLSSILRRWLKLFVCILKSSWKLCCRASGFCM